MSKEEAVVKILCSLNHMNQCYDTKVNIADKQLTQLIKLGYKFD